MQTTDKIGQKFIQSALYRMTALLLLLIVFNNLSGYYLAFYLNQTRIKKEVKNILKSSLDESELIRLRFDVNSTEYRSLIWIDDHEFRFNGRMYDIMRQESDGQDNITFVCINDVKEEELFANLDEQISKHINQNPEKGHLTKIILKILLMEFFQDNSRNPIILNPRINLYPLLESILYLTIIDIPSPPPKSRFV